MSDVNPNRNVGRDSGGGGSPWFDRGLGFPHTDAVGDGSTEQADNVADRAGDFGFQLGLQWGYSARCALENVGEFLALSLPQPIQAPVQRISIPANEDPCGTGYDVVIGYTDGEYHPHTDRDHNRDCDGLGADQSCPFFTPAESPSAGGNSATDDCDTDHGDTDTMTERHPAGRNCAKPAAMMMMAFLGLMALGGVYFLGLG